MSVSPVGIAIESVLKSAGVKNAPQVKAKVIGGTVIVGSALAIFFIARFIKRRNDRLGIRADRKETRAEKKEASSYDVLDMGSEMAQVKVNYSGLTISDGDAILIAQNLLSAMNRFGTDEKAIYSSLEQCKTKDDLLLVIKKFGIKNYDGKGLANTFVDKFDFLELNSMKNLNGWLRAELNRKETAKVKVIYDRLGVAF